MRHMNTGRCTFLCLIFITLTGCASICPPFSEEGHPTVSLFMLADFFSPTDSSGEKPIVPVSEIDPYPGTVWLEGWQNDTLLEITSDVPMEVLDKETGEIPSQEPGAELRNFLWNVSTGDVTEKQRPDNR